MYLLTLEDCNNYIVGWPEYEKLYGVSISELYFTGYKNVPTNDWNTKLK